MKMFGFELTGTQVLYVKCPKCGDRATVTYLPSEKNISFPVPKEIAEPLEKLGILGLNTLPKSEDLHFHCMKCLILLKQCEQFKTKCKLRLET